jgi:hypothetical protein
MRVNIPLHWLGFIFAVLVACVCRADTDTLIATSGQVTGIFKSANSKEVIMTIAHGRDLTIPWGAVQKLTFGQKVLIEGPGFGSGEGIVLNAGDTITALDGSLQSPPPANETFLGGGVFQLKSLGSGEAYVHKTCQAVLG